MPLAKPRDEVADPAPHQRLAAGQPDPRHAARDEDVGELHQLLQRQHVAFGRKLHLLRHAIAAAQVAAVGHRQADIGDPPAVRVDQVRLSFHALPLGLRRAQDQ